MQLPHVRNMVIYRDLQGPAFHGMIFSLNTANHKKNINKFQ